jgi:hypothetical protein
MSGWILERARGSGAPQVVADRVINNGHIAHEGHDRRDPGATENPGRCLGGFVHLSAQTTGRDGRSWKTRLKI